MLMDFVQLVTMSCFKYSLYSNSGVTVEHDRTSLQYACDICLNPSVAKYRWVGRKKGVRIKNTKLHGLSPQASYTDQATAACRRS
jgi:hypothetical protein